MYSKKGQGLDLLLVQLPPWDYRIPPLGLAYLSTFLKSKGIEAKVFDLNIELYNSESDSTKKGWGSEDYYWWRCDRLEQRYALMFNELANKILAFNTQVIGFSALFPSIIFLNHLLRYIKEKAPDKIIIVGGPATFFRKTREDFDKGLINYLVVGEGEIALFELLKAISNDGKVSFPEHSSIKIWKDGPLEETVCVQARQIEDLDSLPSPTFEEFNLASYTDGHFSLPMRFSKGCTRCCTFCGDRVFSNPYRYRKPENAVKEAMMHLARHNNIHTFSLLDLSFNANLKFLDELCARIIAEGLSVQWHGSAQVRSDMKYELMLNMKKAGFHTFNIGVETFSNRLLSMMKKRCTADEIVNFLKVNKEVGIRNFVLLIVGYPGETDEDFNTTLEYIKQNAAYIDKISLNICGMPLYSELWRHPEKYNYSFLPDGDWVSSDKKNTYEVRKKRYNQLIRFCKQLSIPSAQCVDLETLEESRR